MIFTGDRRRPLRRIALATSALTVAGLTACQIGPPAPAKPPTPQPSVAPTVSAPAPTPTATLPKPPTVTPTSPSTVGPPVTVPPTVPPTVAPTSPAPARPAVGMSVHVGALDDTRLEAELTRLSAAGVTEVRLDVNWAYLQPNGPTTWTWGELDREVNAASRHGLGVLALVGWTPAWARQPGCTDTRCKPADPAAFGRFAGAIAQRYPQIREFEIWNEPNSFFMLPGADPGAEAALLGAAYPAIKQASPAAQVAIGGVAPSGNSATSMDPVSFVSKVMDDPRARYDAVAWHPYGYPAFPDTPYTWSAFTQLGTAPTLPGMKTLAGVLAAHGRTGLPVWMTEYGAPTSCTGVQVTWAQRAQGAAMVAANQNDFCTDEQSQAEYVRQFLVADYAPLKVTDLYLYTPDDVTGPNVRDTRENHFGLWRVDGSPKPAVDVLKRYTTG